MGCKGCELATSDPKAGVFYYRIGNKKLGWGNIGILACREHAKEAVDRLNKMQELLDLNYGDLTA
ncbi:MAG TPA: hypothetical protein VGE97_07840 [Nitrososphaera sp.]|jgi:hypothetical protein